MSIKDIAEQFFIACESGQGWDVCQAFCDSNATFSSQTSVLTEITRIEAYTEWMKDLFEAIPNGQYEIQSFGVDNVRQSVIVFGIFRGTHTGQGGPTPPTGKDLVADYVYDMVFEGERIVHMTKIWNDTISLKQLGWS
jgi:predicted ester cyclase